MAAHQDNDLSRVRVALFQADPGWYEAYWYGPEPKPAKRRLGNLIQRLSATLGKIARAWAPARKVEPIASTLNTP